MSTAQTINVDLAALAGVEVIGFPTYVGAITRAFKTSHPDPKTPVSVARIATGVAGLCADLTVGPAVEGKPTLDFMVMRDVSGCTLTVDGKALLPGSIVRAKGLEAIPYAQRANPLKDADVPAEKRPAVSRLRRLLRAAADEMTRAGYSRSWKNAEGVDVAAEVAASRAAHRAEVVGPLAALMGYGRFSKEAAPGEAVAARRTGWEVEVTPDAPAPKAKRARK